METYWLLVCWIKGQKRYYAPRPDMDWKVAGIPYMVRDWLETTPQGTCERFRSEDEAIKRLKHGRSKEHWGGVFQVERIFISR